MSVTLAQARLGVDDKHYRAVIDEFGKSNYIIGNIPFDNTVVPNGGRSLVYGYDRVSTPATAAFRQLNNEYTPQEAQTTPVVTYLKIFGGSYAIDRVLARSTAGARIDQVAFQEAQKIKAAKALFNDAFINGDSAVDSAAFDGLNKAIAGTSTEYNVGGANNIDVSTATARDTNANNLLDMLDEFLGLLDGSPDFLAGNGKLLAKIRSVARRAGYLDKTPDGFGRSVETYNGIPLVDLGEKSGSTNPVVPIQTRDTVTGLTDLYAGRFGLDGLHAAALDTEVPVVVTVPNFAAEGAVHKGEVEMVAAIVLKATKAAGVFRNIKVQ